MVRGRRSTDRRIVAAGLAAVALLGVTAMMLVRRIDDGDGDGTANPGSSAVSTGALRPTTTQPVTTVTTLAPDVRSELSEPLGIGSSGDSVKALQERLTALGFAPGPADGQFGALTQASVWAFEKLVLQVPRAEAGGVVTNEMWQFMQQPIAVGPRRRAAATANHTEVYLPEQVVAFFVDDQAAMISHMSSGTGQAWREEVTIDVGEYGNLNGSAPLVRGEIGWSFTPGGVFSYERFVEGVRNSALGGMWNPAYFNYGIAIHGAINVPLQPASHGCIRIPLTLSETFQDLIATGDQVFVWDGVKEPEDYGEQVPRFNIIDPDYVPAATVPVTTTTTPTA